MQNISGERRVGAHRKEDNSAKRRFALAAVAATAVTSAGAAGATVGAQQENEQINLAADTTILAQGENSAAAPSTSSSEAPQILEVAQKLSLIHI